MDMNAITDTIKSPKDYYFYHVFEVGKIGFLLNDSGLKVMDITALNTDISEESYETKWRQNAEIIELEEENTSSAIIEMAKRIIVELTEYFAGERQVFSLVINPQGTLFQKSVWNALIDIPYGEAISYKTLAQRIGNPKAMRAVGSANGKNPLPIIIPCHRVIQENKTLGGYSGGLGIKVQLLKKEGFSFIEGKSGLKVAQAQFELPLE